MNGPLQVDGNFYDEEGAGPFPLPADGNGDGQYMQQMWREMLLEALVSHLDGEGAEGFDDSASSASDESDASATSVASDDSTTPLLGADGPGLSELDSDDGEFRL